MADRDVLGLDLSDVHDLSTLARAVDVDMHLISNHSYLFDEIGVECQMSM
jgi:hypothetical protein